MKHAISAIIIATAMTCTASSASAGVSVVWANDGEDKVTQDELRATNGIQVKNSVWDGQTITLFGAKNEVVNFNLILEAAGTSATNVNVSMSDLTGPACPYAISCTNIIRYSRRPTGNLFDWTATESELFYVRYLQIVGLSDGFFGALATFQEPTFPPRAQCPAALGPGCAWTSRPVANKFYPDIAVPIELVSNFTIASANNQSIWADIYIPSAAVPGLYTGTVTVSENGQTTYAIPIKLTVKNFALPDMPTSKTMLFSASGDLSPRYGGTTYLTALKNEMLVAHRHKISLIDDNMGVAWNTGAPAAAWLPFLDGSGFTSVNGYAGPGVATGNNVFSIGTYGGMTSGTTQGDFTTNFNNWETWFTQNSPSTERFVYLCDEVICQNGTPSLSTQLQWWSVIAGAGKNLHTLATQFLLDVVTTTLSDPTSSWPFSQGMLDTGSGRRVNGYSSVDQNAANNVRAQEPTRRLYAYGSQRPGEGSIATEEQGTSLRELPWAQYKMNIDRWFIWEATYYNDFQNGRGNINLFTTAATFGNATSSDPSYGMIYARNGDGVLFYPGTDAIYPSYSYGIAGPIASLRLKHWRRGIQDVDYLALASKSNPTAVANLVQQMVPKALWDNQCTDPVSDCSYFTGPVSWSENPDDWEAARLQLANIIEAANQIANPLTRTHDFNGDHKSDIAWRQTGGTAAAWLMNGPQVVQAGTFGVIPTNWQIVGQRDFNGDGTYDWLWRDNNSGTVAIWLLNGLQIIQASNLGAPTSNWVVAGTSDFNGDGKGDILWQDKNTGTLAIWLLNGFQVMQTGILGAPTSNWSIAATDGKGQIFWRDSNTGTVAIWVVNGFQISQAANVGAAAGNWTIIGVGDFNGDGSTDILWRDSNTGTVAIWLLNGPQIMQTGSVGTVGSNWSVAVTGDFDGDGKSDLLWRDSNTGTVAIWFMNGLQISSTANLGAVPTDWLIQGLNAD